VQENLVQRRQSRVRRTSFYGRQWRLLAHCFRPSRWPTSPVSGVVSAFIATAFAQEDAEAAQTQWRKVAGQLRPKRPKLATLMDGTKPEVLA
jgi:hypothetical protein